MIALLFAMLATDPAGAKPRTLLDRQCERIILELARTHDHEAAEWIPLPRATGVEAELLRTVPADARAIEVFLRALFPNLAHGSARALDIRFAHLWRRLPEVTYFPAAFSVPPEPREIVAEWERFRDTFLKMASLPEPRRLVRDVPPEGMRIKYRPIFRKRIAELDPKLRGRIEATPFEARSILDLLALFLEKEGWRNPGSATRAYGRLWLRVFQVAQPTEFEIVRLEDAKATLSPSASENPDARIIEQFRLFKLVYNRNRP